GGASGTAASDRTRDGHGCGAAGLSSHGGGRGNRASPPLAPGGELAGASTAPGQPEQDGQQAPPPGAETLCPAPPQGPATRTTLPPREPTCLAAPIRCHL